jgi:hypothetical protein
MSYFKSEAIKQYSVLYLIFCNSYVTLKTVWFSDEVPETKSLFCLAFIEHTGLRFLKKLLASNLSLS